MKIVVVGLGYVGLSVATLLAQHNEVRAVDIVSQKVEMVRKRISPISDRYISEYLKKPEVIIDARTDCNGLYEWADYIIIATPTNYDAETNRFDTSSIEATFEEIKKRNCNATIVIKSTIPVGYTSLLKHKYNFDNVIFAPEFLREGKALEDNLYPSRIIIGLTSDNSDLKRKGEIFANLLNEGAIKKTDVIFMKSTEAESVKLFANAYLATRVAFFNELDTYAEINNLSSRNIIHGVCADPRIGDFYNNPSFGYGGYCLPKDTKQLKSEFHNIPNNIIDSIVESNATRSKYIADKIVEISRKKSDKPIVGIYRLIMKADSDNFRSSAIQNVIELLREQNIQMIIYEPTLDAMYFSDIKVIHDFNRFKEQSTIIVANRIDKLLSSLEEGKVYTRDIYGKN